MEKTGRWILSPLLLAAVLTATPTAAQDEAELVTDRPDQTESAEVVPPGSWQLEAGWTLTREEEGDLTVETHEAPGSLFRLGLSERVELRLGWSGMVWEEIDGRAGGGLAGDGSVGAKVLLAEGSGRRPQVAVIAATSLPVGEAGATSDRFDPEVRLAVAHELSPQIGLGWNLGVARESTPGPGGVETETVALYTAALGFGVSERLGAFLEVFGEIPLEGGGEDAASIDGGFTWLLSPRLQLDLAAGAGLSDGAPDYFLGVGVSARFD